MERRTTKGTHAIQARAWIEEHLGAGAFQRLCDKTGVHWGLLLPGTWYEARDVRSLLAAAGAELGKSVEDITAEVARRNAEADLTTIYRVVLRVVQPQRLLAFTPQLWSTYVSFGESKAVLNEPGHFIGECHGVPEDLLDWACGAWRGFLPAGIEVAGGKNVRGKIVDRKTGPDGLCTLRFECTYA